MGPIFDPGDQKVMGQAMLETPDDTHVRSSPRMIRRIWIVMMLFFAVMGMLCALFTEFASGVFVTVFAVLVGAMVMKREVDEWMMLRRMRKRAEQSSGQAHGGKS